MASTRPIYPLSRAHAAEIHYIGCEGGPLPTNRSGQDAKTPARAAPGEPMTAPARNQRLLVCNCQRSMDIDGKRLAEALGVPEPLPVHSELCRSQIAAFEAGLASGAAVHVACTQEAPLFREVAAEKRGAEAHLAFTNIRERAGWCADKGAALPKMAALLAE